MSLDIRSLKRKGLIVDRLLMCVDQYYSAFNKPIPMKILAGKFARSLFEYGGVSATIEELRREGTLEITLAENGVRKVYPHDCAFRIDPKARLLK